MFQRLTPFLFAVALLPATDPVVEHRGFGFNRFGTQVEWTETSEGFKETPALPVEASRSLVVAFANPIASVHPYGGEDTGLFRPSILDDLLYESLMLPDPITGSENLYPLIAQAIRHPADFSSVTFEIDGRSRFQDGTAVTGQDILYSIELLRTDKAEAREILDRVVAAHEIAPGEIRFFFKESGAVAREAIRAIATAKIVKSNPHQPHSLGGIPISYAATGPYRIAQLGASQLILVKDKFYWAKDLPTRRGFFNFPRIELRSVPDENNAHNALVAGTVNFFAEKRTNGIERTFSEMSKKNIRLVMSREYNNLPGVAFEALAFNIKRPHLNDFRVREALLLAFDFDKVNRQLFGGSLIRPNGLLDRGSFAPFGFPIEPVKQLLETCGPDLPTDVFSDFSGYGNSRYRRFPDDRRRLLEASRLLQLAGYRLVNGRWVTADNTALNLTLLLREKWQLPIASVYKEDLSHLGVQLDLVMAANPAEFEKLAASGTLDMVSAAETFQTGDGRPTARLFKDHYHANSACFGLLLAKLESAEFGSDDYKYSAEAIGRLQQAMNLDIFIGEPRNLDFIYDSHIRVPSKLTLERVHLYGTSSEN